MPFSGFVKRLIHPYAYPLAGAAFTFATALDDLALAGMAAAFFLGLAPLFKRDWSPMAMAGYAFVLLAAAANWADFWAESYACLLYTSDAADE